MANKYLIIDFNSLGYAAQDTSKLLHNGKEVQAVFNFLRTVKKLAVEYPNYKIVAIDDGGTTWRSEFYPLYKANRSDKAVDEKRKEEKEAYRAQKPLIKRGLNLLGVDYIKQENAEADDVAAYISTRLAGKNLDNHIVLVTSDTDWLQLVSSQICWRDVKYNRTVDARNFHGFTGYDSTRKFLQAKALIGDSSDNINGVVGIGKVTAKELIDKYESVENFVELAQAGTISNLPKALYRLAFNKTPEKADKWGQPIPQLDLFNRNMKLMDLRNEETAPTKETLIWEKAEFDKEGFMEFCEDLYFKTIINQFAEFTAAFTGEYNG